VGSFIAIVKKELRSVTREKTIMIAIIIQLVIASFSSAILVGLLSFYDPDSIGVNFRIRIRLGIVGDTRSPLAEFLKDRNVRVVAFPSSESAESAFEAGQIDAIVFVPETSGIVDLKLFLPESETRSAVILMVLKGPLEDYENHLRKTHGVHVSYTDVEGKPSSTYEFRYSVIIPILMFFPAFVAGSMVVDSICEEFENHTLETLWSAPLSLNVVFGAKIAAALVLAMAQCTLWSMLLRLNRSHVLNLGLVLLLAAVVTAIIAVGSAFISVYFKDRERSQFAYSLLIPLSIGASHLLYVSPMTLLTRLATGDHYTGLAQVTVYAVLLMVLAIAFFSVAEKLVAEEG
jgi:ABC-2 type transport system permease protein